MDTDAVLVSPEDPVVIAKEREDHEKRMPRTELREHTPKLFFLFPPGADSLRPDLQKQANLRTLQLISEEQLNNDELEQLWSLLEQHVSETTTKNQRLISHSDFCRLQMVLSEKCRKFLTASAFAQLLSTSPYLDRVEIDAIQEFTVRQMREIQWRIELTLYDEVGQGYLREYDLENYLMDFLPKLTPLQEQMSPSFQKFYICSVAKRIFFFLDPLQRGRVSICDLLASEMLAELLQQRGKSDSMDESTQKSPFSLPAIRAIYENYLSLDIDRNGLLSKEELAGYGSGTLTSAFLDRVFEESHTYYGEMDYKSFLDFVFALENRQVCMKISSIYSGVIYKTNLMELLLFLEEHKCLLKIFV